MSLSRVTNWNPSDILTATALNGEFDNILNNAASLISPATTHFDLNGKKLIDAVFQNTPVTFTDGDTTPDISGGSVFKTANTSPTTISFFDSGVAGQRIWIVIGDVNTTIDFTGTNLSGNGGTDWTPASGDMLHAVFISPIWYCTLTSNAATIESTWTPSVGGTATYASQNGVYSKRGRYVTVQCRMNITTIGTGSQQVISGLPYPAENTTPTSYGILPIYFNTLSTNVATVVGLTVGSTVQLYSTLAAGSSMAGNSILGNGTDLYFSGTYYAAS